MRRTFYVASPEHNRAGAAELADYLVSQGWRWALNHNWTEFVAKDWPKDDPQLPSIAAADVKSALACDLFVLLLKDKPSAGATGEFTARWAMGREIHVIRNGADWHLFHILPGVIEHETTDDFLAALKTM
jgi:hypothetical protein